MDLTTVDSKSTYSEIKQYILDNVGFKVSQVKRKHGIIEIINYNIGKNKAKVPQVSQKKKRL